MRFFRRVLCPVARFVLLISASASEDCINVRSMRLECFSLLIVPLGRHKSPMTQQRSGNPDMLGIPNCKRSCSCVPEKVRVDCHAKCLFGMTSYAIIDRDLSHRRAIGGHPKSIVDSFAPPTAHRHTQTSVP